MRKKVISGKKIIIFGAGVEGCRALNYFGSERVHCFADNNKSGQTCMNKAVISFEELIEINSEYDVIIAVGAATIDEIEHQFDSESIGYYYLGDIVPYDDFDSKPEIKHFQDKHKGERCFLIGNGPSLTADDLTKLHENNEITFGCNMIGKMFTQTAWRPDYYVIIDVATINFQHQMIAEIEAKSKFIVALDHLMEEEKVKVEKVLDNGIGDVFYYRSRISLGRVGETISSDASKYVYTGVTVMNSMIQMALYMGFEEIYLLGVDGGSLGNDNKNEYSHFYKDNDEAEFTEKVLTLYNSLADEDVRKRVTANLYENAENYAKVNGTKILNATRGGVIENFKRVNFDDVFND